MTPEQVRWGLEHLDLTEARLKELSAAGLFPTVKTCCADHEGSGMVKFQQWDGKRFKTCRRSWPATADGAHMVEGAPTNTRPKRRSRRATAPRK